MTKTRLFSHMKIEKEVSQNWQDDNIPLDDST